MHVRVCVLARVVCMCLSVCVFVGMCVCMYAVRVFLCLYVVAYYVYHIRYSLLNCSWVLFTTESNPCIVDKASLCLSALQQNDGTAQLML